MSKIRITIDNKIHISYPPSGLSREVKRALSFPNPAYDDAISFNRTTRGVPKKIRLYEELNGILSIPRGSWDVLSVILNEQNIEIDVTNGTASFEKTELPKSIKLWEYQEPWVEDMLKSTQGVGIAPPGSGKTLCALKIYETIGQPCLWITHTQRLATQVARRAEQFLGIESGFIGGGKEDIKHFTVGLVPTLVRRDLSKYRDTFGTILIDECFVAGTMVGGTPIERVKIGDIVDSYDTKTEKIVKRKVVRLFKKKPSKLITLHVGETSVTCTPNHTIVTKRGKIRVDELTLTDEVLIYGKNRRTTASWSRVDSITVHEQTSDGKFGGVCSDGYTYNFEVEGTHTYTANGLVVFNCHHTPASTFLKVISEFSARYRYGVTATPYREDKLEKLIFSCIGPQLAYLDKEDLRSLGKLMTPQIVRKHTNYYFPYNPTSKKHNYHALVDDISSDFRRNQQIATDVIVESTLDDANICIVLVGRIKHGEELLSMIDPVLPNTGFVHSKMKLKERDRILDDFESGKFRVLIATYKMLAEGFDYQPSNRLFLTAPFKGRSLIEQACGRIERAFPGKTSAVVFDYVDVRVGVLTRQAETRLDVYELNNNPVMSLSS